MRRIERESGYHPPRRLRLVPGTEIYLASKKRAVPHLHKHTPPEGEDNEKKPAGRGLFSTLREKLADTVCGMEEWSTAVVARIKEPAVFIWQTASRKAEADSHEIGEAALKMGEAGRAALGSAAAEFVVRKTSVTGLRWGVREATKGVLLTSGIVGLIGGGIVGTAASGAIVGGVSAAAVDYVRQVNANLDKRSEAVKAAETLEVHPADGRKSAFLAKIEGLRYKEAYAADFSRLGKAVVVGAVMGAGAGEAASLIKDHGTDIASFAWDHGGQNISEWADGVRQRFGETVEAAKKLRDKDAPDTLGRGIAFVVGYAHGVGGRIGDMEQQARQIADNFRHWTNLDKGNPPAGYVSQTEYDTLTQQNQDLSGQVESSRQQLETLTEQNHDLKSRLDDLNRQLAEAHSSASPDLQQQIDNLTQQNQHLSKQEVIGPNALVTIPEGGSFWNSIQMPPEDLAFGSPDGWINPENGVSQEDVVRGYLVKYAAGHGSDLDRIKAGTYSFKSLVGLTDEEEDFIGKILATKSAEEYFTLLKN